jgi:hypothetical protein
MLIRARCRADIFTFLPANQDLPSIEHPPSDEARDYRWRMSISRIDWVLLAARLSEAVDYSNFKVERVKFRSLGPFLQWTQIHRFKPRYRISRCFEFGKFWRNR